MSDIIKVNRNMGAIKVALQFEPGVYVLNGEGGIGKTLLLNAIWGTCVEQGRPVAFMDDAISEPKVIRAMCETAQVWLFDDLEDVLTRKLMEQLTTELPWTHIFAVSKLMYPFATLHPKPRKPKLTETELLLF